MTALPPRPASGGSRAARLLASASRPPDADRAALCATLPAIHSIFALFRGQGSPPSPPPPPSPSAPHGGGGGWQERGRGGAWGWVHTRAPRPLCGFGPERPTSGGRPLPSPSSASPSPAPLQRAAHSALPVYDCAQLDCTLPPRVRFGGASSTLHSADGESHCSRPAPATAALVMHSGRPAADCSQLGCGPGRARLPASAPGQPLPCRLHSVQRGRRVTR